MSIVTVYNLASEVSMTFYDVDLKWAVVYAYCEENNRLSWLFSHRDKCTLDQAYKALPITQGSKTVCCGDWCCKL